MCDLDERKISCQSIAFFNPNSMTPADELLSPSVFEIRIEAGRLFIVDGIKPLIFFEKKDHFLTMSQYG